MPEVVDVSLSITSGDIARKMTMLLVKSDPDRARELLIELGNTEAEADEKMAEYTEALDTAEVKRAMKSTADSIVESLQTAVASIDLPDDIAKLTVSVKFDSAVLTETGQPIGWVVTNPAITPTGSDKAINFGSSATGTRKSSGGKSKVKIPEDAGYKNWTAYGEATYPDHTWKGRSAPRELAKLKDEVFLKAAADAGITYDTNGQTA